MTQADPGARSLIPELAQMPGHLLWRSRGRVRLIVDELAGGVDLHAYAVLLVLSEASTPLSQQTIADRIAASRTTVATLSKTLVADGLILRRRNPEDRRGYLLSITDEGSARLTLWRDAVGDVEVAVADVFPGGQHLQLKRLLNLLLRAELDPATPADLSDDLVFLMTRASQSLHRVVAGALAPLGLEPRHMAVLRALRGLGPVPQTELGRAIGVSSPSTVQIVDDLETAGLVERIRPPDDRRTQVLHLLPAAGPTLEAVHAAADPVADRWLGPLTRAQVADLVRLLGVFVTAP